MESYSQVKLQNHATGKYLWSCGYHIVAYKKGRTWYMILQEPGVFKIQDLDTNGYLQVDPKTGLVFTGEQTQGAYD